MLRELQTKRLVRGPHAHHRQGYNYRHMIVTRGPPQTHHDAALSQFHLSTLRYQISLTVDSIFK